MPDNDPINNNDQSNAVVHSTASNSQTSSNTHWWIAPTSGFLSGVVGGVACAGFEGLKKEVQKHAFINGPSSNISFFKNPSQFIKDGLTNSLSTLKNPFQFVKYAYKGTGSFILALGPTSAVQISMDNMLKTLFGNNDSLSLQFSCLATAGAFGGISSGLVEFLVLYQRMKHITMFAASKELVSNGLRYSFTAVPPLMVREMIFGSSMLWGANAAEKYVIDKTGSKSAGYMATLGIGIIGALASQPFDTAATRKQVTAIETGKTISTFKAFENIVKQQGAKACWTGALPRIGLFTTAMIVIGGADKRLQKELSKLADDFSPAPKKP